MVGKCQKKIEKLHSWIFNHPKAVNSPLTNEHVNIKYNTTGEVITTKKLLLKIPNRELQNDIINHYQRVVFLVQYWIIVR